MPIAYYGSRISENMTRTPEGYLICHNVPIARTGCQDYLASELGLREGGTVQVFRPEAEVFADKTKASFESKPVTDDHPNDVRGVTPDNYASLEKGHVRNVRRGAGEEAELLIADLVIRDQRLIDAIEGGKREVSCGYQCVYEEDGDRYVCRDITGNHVAVVQNGRAGPKVAIKDEQPKRKEKRSMARPNKETLRGRIIAAFARDEESTPEEVSTVADMLEEPKESLAPAPEPEAKDEGGDPMAGALAKILEELGAIKAALAPQKADEDPVAALEHELTGDSTEEESVTIPAEQIDDEEPAEEEKEKETETANDSARALLTGIKPVLAAIQDPQQRRLAQDAAVKEIRARMTQTQPATYGGIVNQVRDKAKGMAKDTKEELDLAAVTKAYQSKNPHILKEAK
jgi:hypothetical protein